MTRSRVWWIYGGTAAFLLLALGVTGYRTLLLTPVKLAKPQTVDIRQSASFGYVASRLEARHLIPSAFALKVYARLTRKDNQMKVGEYEITSGQRPIDILNLLVSGRAAAFWVTIPEGKWSAEIDTALAAHWPEAAKTFPALITQPVQWRGKVPFPITGNTLEGYLFPDTYRFAKGTDANKIVQTMLDRFQGTCWEAYTAHPPADGRSLHDVLVLASLVEAEAKRPEERPIIAGVYMNRLRQKMLLQCDATVLYAHKQRLSRVLLSDLAIDSPYNTYKYPGLPPGPIDNPGLSAFQAALHPAKTPYLYYVARGDGSHVFSRTMAEHQAAIRKIRGK